MTPAEREEVVNFAQKQQSSGQLLAWSIDEVQNKVELYVPLDADASSFPSKIGRVALLLNWLPRPVELDAKNSAQ